MLTVYEGTENYRSDLFFWLEKALNYWMNLVLGSNGDDGGIKAQLQENTDTLKEDASHNQSRQQDFPPPVNLRYSYFYMMWLLFCKTLEKGIMKPLGGSQLGAEVKDLT